MRPGEAKGSLVPDVAVSRAEYADVYQLAAVLACALFDLRVSAFLIPHVDQRRRMLPQIVSLAYLQPALADGVLWCTGDRTAAAAWLCHSPGQPHQPDPQVQAALSQVTGRWYPRLQRFDELLAEAHAPFLEIPHDFLGVLGVYPDLQRQRAGTALLAAYHRHLDSIGRPAYLQAVQLELIGFFQRFGYVETGHIITLPNHATVHPMWREPQPAP